MERFATLIPTLNRGDANTLEYLKLCVKSFKKYSSPKNRLSIHVDGLRAETPKWLDDQGIEYTQSEWRGVPKALNKMIKESEEEILILLNDDLVCSPNWDINLVSWFTEELIVCPSCIAPIFGSSPKEFNEKAFVDYVETHSSHTYKNEAWGILSFKKGLWSEMGGFDETFSPYGLWDADFLYRIMKKHPEMKFIVVNDSILYHFVMGAKKKLQLNPETKWETVGPEPVRYFCEKHGAGTGEITRRLRVWWSKK